MLFLLAVILLAAAQQPARGQLGNPSPAPTPIGIVTPWGGGHATIPIAITPFEGTGLGLDLAAVVMNDLKLSGFFTPPPNEQFARETDLLDRSKGSIQFAEWHRIGVLYLVKGSYKIVDGKLQWEFKTWDTVAQNYIFGEQPKQAADAGEARQEAHQIANDLIKRLTGEEGFADTQLTFIRANDRYGKSKQVCTMDADGVNLHAVTKQGELTTTPCWGLHGTEIYYTTYRDYNPDLAGVILRTGITWWISRYATLNISADWSEKAGRIALTLAKDGNSEIYTMSREGRDVRRMTTNRAIDCTPCWSPDGTQIAFTSDRSGNNQIWIMDARTQETRRLTYNGSYNDSASWAKGGSNKIAYASRVSGTFQICTINPDGTGFAQITHGEDDCEDPTWAPNGWVMAYVSNRTGSRHLYTMFADGTPIARLTSSGVQNQSPNWGPARH